MTGITLQEALKPEVIELLSNQQLTITELADKLGRNYYTTRGTLKLLLDEGIARPVGYGGRNCKYMLQNEQGPNRIIPSIKVGKQTFKLTDLLQSRLQKEPAAALAVFNLPRHLVRIFKVGENLYKGQSNVAVSLESIRIQMSEDRQALQRALDIYDQVLSNPRIWDAEVLVKWPDDEFYNAKEVEETYEHFFG